MDVGWNKNFGDLKQIGLSHLEPICWGKCYGALWIELLVPRATDWNKFFGSLI